MAVKSPRPDISGQIGDKYLVKPATDLSGTSGIFLDLPKLEKGLNFFHFGQYSFWLYSKLSVGDKK